MGFYHYVCRTHQPIQSGLSSPTQVIADLDWTSSLETSFSYYFHAYVTNFLLGFEPTIPAWPLAGYTPRNSHSKSACMSYWTCSFMSLKRLRQLIPLTPSGNFVLEYKFLQKCRCPKSSPHFARTSELWYHIDCSQSIYHHNLKSHIELKIIIKKLGKSSWLLKDTKKLWATVTLQIPQNMMWCGRIIIRRKNCELSSESRRKYWRAPWNNMIFTKRAALLQRKHVCSENPYMKGGTLEES